MSTNVDWLQELLDSATTPEEIQALSELIAEEEALRLPPMIQGAPGRNLTSEELGRALGVSSKTIKRYWARGCPRDDVDAVIQWREDNIKAVAEDAEATEISIEMRRAELADKLEAYRFKKLKNERLAGQMIERQVVQHELSVIFGRLRDRITSLGTECANIVPQELKAAIKRVIDERMRLAMKEMADVADTLDQTEEPAE